jgi:sugar phosphate isomerase/epimerase
MKLAINGQILARIYTLPETLDAVKALGVNAIEFWPHNLEGGETPEERERYETKDVAAALTAVQAAGIEVACLTLGFNALRICTERGGAAGGTEALIGAVDTAAMLGAPIVNCYLAHISPTVFVEAMKPAATYAGTKGVTIVLENEAHDDSGPSASVAAIVAAVGVPHFGTQYDPCNYYHAYEEPYPYAYELVKAHVRYVHLKGGCYYDPRWCIHRGGVMRGETDRFIGYLPLPETAFNVDTILRRLAQDGYDGYITLEPHVPPNKVMEVLQIEAPYIQERLRRI